MKKALNAWSVPSEVPFDAMFASLAKAGFEGVELNVDRAGASAHALSLASTAADYAAIRASAERAGLALPTISTTTERFGTWASSIGISSTALPSSASNAA